MAVLRRSTNVSRRSRTTILRVNDRVVTSVIVPSRFSRTVKSFSVFFDIVTIPFYYQRIRALAHTEITRECLND